MSPTCIEISSIKGEVYYSHTVEEYDKIKSFENCSGNMMLLWRKSNNAIAVVNLNEFKIMKEISSF